MNKIKENNIFDKLNYFILILCLGMVPLTVHVKVHDFVSPQITVGIINTGTKGEAFTYYKWLLLILFSAMLISILISKIVISKYEIGPSYINIPVLVLAALFLISLLNAEYVYIALCGIYDRFDGTITWLCYLTVLICMANIKFDMKIFKYVNICLAVVIVVEAIFSLTYYFGYNLANVPFVYDLFKPWGREARKIEMNLSTILNNPNYSSGFAAATCGYFTAVSIFMKGMKEKIFPVIMASVSFVLILTSLSSSGFLSIIIVLAAVIIPLAFLKAPKIEAAKTLAINIVIFGILLTSFTVADARVYRETVGSLQSFASIAAGILSYKVEKEPKVIDEKYPEFSIPESGVSAGSGRAYIWKRSIPLVFDRPVFGHGMDTYSYYFPQFDKEKVAGMGSYNVYITKPHNLYLGIAIGAGIPALLTLLFLFAAHFFITIKRLLKSSKQHLIPFQLALLTFFTAFLIQWNFNDSIIGTSIIFWSLLGISACINAHVRQESI